MRSGALLLAAALGALVPSGLAFADEVPAGSAPPAVMAAPAESSAGTALPAELEGVDIVDRSGESVPLDLALTDETGAPVRLGDFFGQGRPVVIQLVYFECPMLCTFVLNGYLEGAKRIDWTPGREYEVVTVSFDPRDTPAVAAAKKVNYVASLGRPGAAAGWHFLTGNETEIRRLADALGFRYRWLEDRKEFAHAAGMFVLTPGGKVSRTLYGIEFSPRDFRLSLVEAGEGRLGSPFDHFLLYCFRYDAETHRYALIAINVMKIAGLATVIGLGAFLAVFWSREHRRRPPAGAAAAGKRA